jgi:hypothetical protein
MVLVVSAWCLVAAGLAGMGGSSPAAARSAVLLEGCWPTDLGRPVLDDETASPTSVDVTEAARSVSFTVHAHDVGGPGAASGVVRVQAFLSAPSGPVDGYAAELRPDAAHTEWTGSVTLPQWAVPRGWSVNIGLWDAAGNVSWYGRAMPSGDTDSVSVTAPDQANTPMLEVAGYHFSSHLDTRRHARRQTFTVSGSSRTGPPIVGGLVLAADAAEPGLARLVLLHHVTGQTWRGSTMIPRWAGSGEWSTEPLLVDATGYTGGLDNPPPVPTTFSVTSDSDLTAPRVVGLRVGPRPLDARAGSARLHALVRISDAQSGVGTVRIRLTEPADPASVQGFGAHPRVVDLHPARSRQASAALPTAMRHSRVVRHLVARYGLAQSPGSTGPATSPPERWVGSVPYTPCEGVPGAWRLSLQTSDLDGNGRTLAVRALQRQDLQSHLRIRQQDRVPPTLEAAVVDSSTDFADFYPSEPVVGLDPDTATVLDVTDSDSPVPVSGHWECTDAQQHAVDCDTGPDVLVRYVVDAGSWTKGDAYVVRLDLGASQEFTDLSGNPCSGEGCIAGFRAYHYDP